MLSAPDNVSDTLLSYTMSSFGLVIACIDCFVITRQTSVYSNCTGPTME